MWTTLTNPSFNPPTDSFRLCFNDVFSLPDVFIRGEQDDRSGVASVQQQTDDFIKVRGFVVMRDLQGLSNADST